MASGKDSRLLQALDRAQSKKDTCSENKWSSENKNESGDDFEKNEINLLALEDGDVANSHITEQKSKLIKLGPVRTAGDTLKTYERKVKTLHLRPLRGNATGLNMLGASRKLGENTQNMGLTHGTLVQGRIFHHTNITRSIMKTAAQSSLERKERKEYPAHVPKVDIDPIRTTKSLENTEAGSGPESMEQNAPVTHCTSCVKENKNKLKCQNCGDAQSLFRQNNNLSESRASLARPAIHGNATLEVSAGKGLNAKNFYGSSYNRLPTDTILNDTPRWKQYPANGKLGLSSEANLSKVTKNTRVRSTRSSEPNDTIILSSDDEDNTSTGSTSRIESISPQPADSACSSPVPSSGKVEAALRENSLLDNKFNSLPEAEFPIIIPRKARMKDQFGNPVNTTPVKRRKVSQLDVPSEAMPSSYTNTCESLILRCRNIRIGTFCKNIVEPVVFCIDYIKMRLEADDEDSDADHQEIMLKTSDLTKCEWCSARKLTVVFFQSTISLCQKLRTQFRMSKQNGAGWYDCKATNVEEQFIVLIFESPLSMHENAVFEKLLAEIGKKYSVTTFLYKIGFDEANRRLVAFTKHIEEMPSRGSTTKDQITRSVLSETRMKSQNIAAQLQFDDDDDDEVHDTHNVFVGPVEKLIVYPPPPAKGGISVTNEDLHCLNEGEFLNDVIIDFYLKYLVLEKLRDKADRIHIFSSFFYKRLNQRERRSFQETANLTLQQRRHGRVKTWTRHVDIFQKDFIFVPLNEAAHWFLAVICFPGLEEPVHFPNPIFQGTGNISASTTGAQSDDSRSSVPQSESQTGLQGSSLKSPLKKTTSKKQSPAADKSSASDESDTPGNRRGHRKSDQGLQDLDINRITTFTQTDSNPKNVNGIGNECKTPLKQIDGLHRIQISYSDSPDDPKKNEEECIDFSDDQDNLDESSDDGGLADDNFTSEAGKWHLKPTLCKQPCILLMDSLRGPSRSTVVKTLREYLEVEWEVRKGSKRSFSKEFMKGSNPRVPQQNNFSDCGVFILQYVESFFENPIQSFDLPMNLTDWFPQQRMKTKREEIRNIILTLQELQSKKGQRDLSTVKLPLQEEFEPL